MQHLLNDRLQEEQGFSLTRLWSAIVPLFFHRGASRRESQKFLEMTGGLSLDSAMTLKKVQGMLRDDWAAALSAPIQPHRGKANRWADATLSHVHTIHSRLTAPLGPPKIQSHAPTAQEEVRGLDDIFPGQMPEDILPPPTVIMQNVIAALPPQPVAEVSEIVIPAPEAKAKSTSPEIGEATPQPTVAAIEPAPQIQMASVAPEAPKTIPQPTPIEAIEPVAPAEQPIAPLIAQETIEKAIIQEVIKKVEASAAAQPAPEPISAPLETRIQPAQFDSRTTPPKDAPISKPMSSTGSPIASTSQNAQPPQPSANQPLPGIREQLQLDQHLEADLSSFDYMIRNNKILATSITTLAEQYFQRAAEEGEITCY